MASIRNARIAVFGVDGVGRYVVEALARSGVETFDLIDDDKVCISNLNKQVIATRETLGRYKVDVIKEKIHSFTPEVNINVHKRFYLDDKSDEFDFSQYSYIIDAIDTVADKVELVIRAKEAGIPIISCMGTGSKVDPKKFQVADIYKTSMCPLAKVMCRELRKRGVKKHKVVYSEERPDKIFGIFPQKEEPVNKGTISSMAFTPSVAGVVMAGEIVQDLLKNGIGK